METQRWPTDYLSADTFYASYEGWKQCVLVSESTAKGAFYASYEGWKLALPAKSPSNVALFTLPMRDGNTLRLTYTALCKGFLRFL